MEAGHLALSTVYMCECAGAGESTGVVTRGGVESANPQSRIRVPRNPKNPKNPLRLGVRTLKFGTPRVRT